MRRSLGGQDAEGRGLTPEDLGRQGQELRWDHVDSGTHRSVLVLSEMATSVSDNHSAHMTGIQAPLKLAFALRRPGRFATCHP